VGRGMAIVGLGTLAVIAAAPFDEFWHRTFGRDVDMWSPPHLFAIYGGGILIYLGWTVAAATNVFVLSARLRDALVVFFASGVVSTLIFGMNFYYMMGWSREALFFPLVVCAIVPFALAFTIELQQQKFAATVAALTYTAFALLTFVALRVLGWLPPAFPPWSWPVRWRWTSFAPAREACGRSERRSPRRSSSPKALGCCCSRRRHPRPARLRIRSSAVWC